MNKCDNNCKNGIIWKQIALGDYMASPCDCIIKKELDGYENWFGVLRKT